MTGRPHKVVLFGEISVDLYPNAGTAGPGYVLGGSMRWTSHVGGNAPNAGAYLAMRARDIDEVAYAGVLGTDGLSDQIREHLECTNIVDRSLTENDHYPAISIHSGVNGTLPRDQPCGSVGHHLTARYIRRASAAADVVIVGSFFGEPDILPRVLKNVPAESVAVGIPGSGEYRDYPTKLLQTMRERPLWLLPLNETELRALYREPHDNIETLVKRAGTELAENVLCTQGADGAYLYRDGKLAHGNSARVDPEKIVDVTGAGDRAAAIAIQELLAQRLTSQQILAEIAAGTVPVLTRLGAQADLTEAHCKRPAVARAGPGVQLVRGMAEIERQ